MAHNDSELVPGLKAGAETFSENRAARDFRDRDRLAAFARRQRKCAPFVTRTHGGRPQEGGLHPHRCSAKSPCARGRVRVCCRIPAIRRKHCRWSLPLRSERHCSPCQP